MCGIAGALSFTEPLATERLKSMVDALAHRGPDDSGFLVWQSGKMHSRGNSFGMAFNEEQFRHISPLLPSIDTPAGQERLAEDHWDLFLGHRRLAIIDLSPRGHQPMANKDQSIWIIFNGEIYNYRELRSELEQRGYRFSSASDTEVLIHGYEEWGAEAITRLNGMFAFALWDLRSQVLLLARDRYGVKPLYYYQTDSLFAFASEIKSIHAYLKALPELDLLALNNYFTFQNSLTDRTLFQNIRMLPPGHWMSIDFGTGTIDRHQYWDFDFRTESEATEEQLEEELYHLMEQAIRRQCVSDVPVGSYLSGGLDSGTVTAVTRSVFGRIYTFTAGFDLSEAAAHEVTFDERERAEHMANLFKTEHYECVLHAGDMEAVMPQLIWHLEDLRVGQCYPNFYAARLVSKFVKVVMSGVGGDELFGGYPWRYAAAIGATGNDWVRNYYHYWQRLVVDEEKTQLFNPDIVSQFKKQTGCTFGEHSLQVFKDVFCQGIAPRTKADQVNLSLYFECKSFLHGLLAVEDKISMAFGLETRVPFLDNDLVDLACKIPVRYKVPELEHLERLDENMPRKKEYILQTMQTGKSILRKAMQRLLSPSILQARKQGFSAPDESWFRGESEQYIRSLLLHPSSRCQEILNPAYLRRTIDTHASGKANKRLLIWSLVCLEWWLRTFQGEAGSLSAVA